jgi:hypothetical protein
VPVTSDQLLSHLTCTTTTTLTSIGPCGLLYPQRNCLQVHPILDNNHRTPNMAPAVHVVPIVDSTSIFKPDIFKGKVLFCTGGGSGICRGMTEAMVRRLIFVLWEARIMVHRCVMARMQPSLVGSVSNSDPFSF